jgi:hypothetical protein
MQKALVSALALCLLLSPLAAFASDKSDAEDLMNRCEASSKSAAVPVRNFGDKDLIASLENGLALIKQGKVKLLQSKYIDAKAKFEEYQKLEGELYAALAPKYLERAQAIIDKAAEDLVDFAAKPEVTKGFSESDRSVSEAKVYQAAKKYLAVIQACRVAKNQVLAAYAAAKVEIPADFKRDQADSSGKIFLE